METLNKLYQTFYQPSHLPLLDTLENEQHQALNELLPPEHRKQILRLIDTKNYITCVRTEESFLQGFALALRHTEDLQHQTYRTTSQDTSNV